MSPPINSQEVAQKRQEPSEDTGDEDDDKAVVFCPCNFVIGGGLEWDASANLNPIPKDQHR